MNNRRWVSPHSLTGVDLLKAKQQQKQKTQDECGKKTLRMLKIRWNTREGKSACNRSQRPWGERTGSLTGLNTCAYVGRQGKEISRQEYTYQTLFKMEVLNAGDARVNIRGS